MNFTISSNRFRALFKPTMDAKIIGWWGRNRSRSRRMIGFIVMLVSMVLSVTLVFSVMIFVVFMMVIMMTVRWWRRWGNVGTIMRRGELLESAFKATSVEWLKITKRFLQTIHVLLQFIVLFKMS